jgi:hypothetical protein
VETPYRLYLRTSEEARRKENMNLTSQMKRFSYHSTWTKEYARGQVSQTELARLFDDWGLDRYRGQKTKVQFVSGLLFKHLRFYAGIVFNPWSKEEIRGLHKPMIDEEEYYKIRMRISGKGVKITRHKVNPTLSLCGKPSSAESAGKP